ncbi:MAG: Holliday junction branch migration protein RuvA [Gemmataceae bacterium]
MITKLTGTLNRVLDEEVRVQVGPIEYQVLVPEFVRRQLHLHIGKEVTLSTTQYLEGNQMSNRLVPRLIGFPGDVELEFFDLFCTVDKIGVRKAIKALNRPIREIADAIQRTDAKWLTTLPGIGPNSAKQVIATLQHKVTKFALMPGLRVDGEAAPRTSVAPDIIEDAYQALLSVGHGPAEARSRLDQILSGGKTFKSAEDVLLAIYAKP